MDLGDIDGALGVPRRERQPALGIAASAFAAAGWGVAAVFVVLAHEPPLLVSEYRLAVAAIMLVLAVVLTRRRLWLVDLRLVVLGGVLLGADMACFFTAIERTSIADASVISALQPALVMLVARPLFKERVHAVDVAWTAVAIAGVGAAVVGGGVPSGTSFSGDVLAGCSLLAWTGYFLVSKRARQATGALEYTCGVTVVAAVTLLPVLALSGEPLAVTRPGAWLWIVLVAIVPGTAHLLMNWSQRLVDVSILSVVGSSNPLFAAACAWLVLGQRLTALQVGCGLVAIVAISSVAGRRRVDSGAAVEPAVVLGDGDAQS